MVNQTLQALKTIAIQTNKASDNWVIRLLNMCFIKILAKVQIISNVKMRAKNVCIKVWGFVGINVSLRQNE